MENIEVYRGIPYAKPPLGDLRFADPVSIDPWTKTFDATKLGNDCPQFDFTAKLFWGNEDCLVLDVYVPHRPVKKPLPIYFWIYGGGWMLGSKWEFGVYDPFKLMADNDFIFIAANYRLGPLGFLALEGSSGLMGLLDQTLALKWAKANAAAFGGDPNHITIGGESAGAFSTCYHLASPLSAGLFTGAIMESGTCDSPEFFRTQENDLSFSHAFGMSFGCNGTDPDFTSCLKKIGPGSLMSMYPDLSKYKKTHFIPSLYPVMPWAATTGGAALPNSPLRVMKTGQFNNVPLLIGTNANETNLFLFYLLEKMEPVYDDLFADFFFNNQTFIAEIKKEYNWTNPELKQRDLYSRLMTDYIFACPSRRAIRANNVKNTTWEYQWDYRSGIAEKLIGDGHATEIVYVFQHPWVLAEFTPKDRQIASMLKHYWLNFIKNHDPNSQSKPAYPNWLPYKADYEYLLINDPTTTRMEVDLDPETCDFWDQYAATY
jgi:para-nitrobenzyl esterase